MGIDFIKNNKNFIDEINDHLPIIQGDKDEDKSDADTTEQLSTAGVSKTSLFSLCKPNTTETVTGSIVGFLDKENSIVVQGTDENIYLVKLSNKTKLLQGGVPVTVAQAIENGADVTVISNKIDNLRVGTDIASPPISGVVLGAAVQKVREPISLLSITVLTARNKLETVQIPVNTPVLFRGQPISIDEISNDDRIDIRRSKTSPTGFVIVITRNVVPPPE